MEPEVFILLFLLATFAFVFLVLILDHFSEKKEQFIYVKELDKLKEFLQLGKIDQKTYERMIYRLEEERNYAKESERLESLVHNKKIDQATYERLRKELEQAHKERLERLKEEIPPPQN
ncbi:MAG: hypothetical protein QXL52_04685 [Nitrososphaerales archaeon]